MGYYFSILNYYVAFFVAIFIFFSPVALAQGSSVLRENLPSYYSGDAVLHPDAGLTPQFPLYQVGSAEVDSSASNQNGKAYQSTPVKRCIYGLVFTGNGDENAFISYSAGRASLYPVPFQSWQLANGFQAKYTCDAWVLLLKESDGQSDPFGENGCDNLSKVNTDFLSKFLFFLPDVPQEFRISYILSQFAGGDDSFLGFLLSEIWIQVSPLLLIYVGVKAYKLLPFV